MSNDIEDHKNENFDATDVKQQCEEVCGDTERNDTDGRTCSTRNIRAFFRPVDSSIFRRPGVEWIYPAGYDGPRHEYETDIESENQIIESIGGYSIEYVVDPNDVEVTISVDGILVQNRLCFVKMCGFVVCDDNFPFLINAKIPPCILGLLFVTGLIVVSILLRKKIGL